MVPDSHFNWTLGIMCWQICRAHQFLQHVEIEAKTLCFWLTRDSTHSLPWNTYLLIQVLYFAHDAPMELGFLAVPPLPRAVDLLLSTVLMGGW